MKLIYSDNAVLSDFSLNATNYHSGDSTFSFIAAQDYFYIGSRFAFNQFYLKMSTANTASSAMSISYWDGNSWESAVEVIDSTSGLSQDGNVTFVPDKQYGWMKDDTVRADGSTEEVTGLGSVTIYDRYWIRVSFSNDLDANVKIGWIGRLFATDEDVYSEYPMFNNSGLKSAIESGKTTYEEQRLRATEVLIDNLITKKVIDSGHQLLDAEKLKTATVSKTAEIIFSMLGFDEYEDDRIRANREYQSRINKDIFNADQNDNALLDDKETTIRQGRMWR